MSVMYTVGGACLGAGILGAATLDKQWTWLLILAVLIIGTVYLIEKFNP